VVIRFFFISLLFLFSSHENENDQYIQKVISRPEKLIKYGKFEKGYILKNGDTIHSEILKFIKRKEMNSFLFCLIKNKADSIQLLTAKQIDGYSVGDEIYRKHISNNDCFFIRLNRAGRALLYERAPIPSDTRFIYYLKLPEYKDFFILAPEHDKITFITLPLTAGAKGVDFLYYNTTENQNDIFKRFINTYMADCKELNILIASNYFTIFDLPGIIEKYNKCFN
jgi:hypothetical protein